MTNYEIRNDFPILRENKIAYLDSGATTQRPIQVLDKVDNFYKSENANPHRGAYKLSIQATEVYENARQKVADFINAPSARNIVFTRNATESLNLLAYSYGLNNVKKDDKIVLSIMEHHSNLVPWQMVCQKNGAKLEYMYTNSNGELTTEEIDKKIVPGVKIVGITQVSNVLGTINPIKEIIKKAHSVGAIVIVDGSQSVPHMKVDVQKLDADFLVFSGHKMLSPFGIGVLYGKNNLLDSMTPFLFGGDMIEYVYEQETIFAEVPTKFEAGTQNVGGAVGISAAIDYLKNIGMENIEKIEKELTKYAYEELSKLDFITLYGPKDLQKRSGVFSFNVNGVHPHDVASVLDSQDVCVRSGNHCAQPLLRYMNLDSTCRASLYVYNTKEDIDRLVKALIKTRDVFAKWIK
ncbi:cysteine desulfurase [Clostridium sp. CAG:793]|nr:cysteine desulfurase [Clostridium sp. CAG:793]